MDRVPDFQPDDGKVITADLVDKPELLVKAFGLGVGASVAPHDHPRSTNVFHVLSGTITIIQDDKPTPVAAPGVVLHDPGVSHGARNESDEVAVFTATLCPPP